MNARPPVRNHRNIKIGKVDLAPYLGIELDTVFTFLSNVKKLGTKARNVFGTNVRLLKVSYGANTVNPNFLYRTGYVSIMAYASNLWIQKLVDNYWAIKENIK